MGFAVGLEFGRTATDALADGRMLARGAADAAGSAIDAGADGATEGGADGGAAIDVSGAVELVVVPLLQGRTMTSAIMSSSAMATVIATANTGRGFCDGTEGARATEIDDTCESGSTVIGRSASRPRATWRWSSSAQFRPRSRARCRTG